MKKTMKIDEIRELLLKEGAELLKEVRREKETGKDTLFISGQYHEITFIAEALGIAEFEDFGREIEKLCDEAI
jgi:hypothetical protein